MGEFMDPLREIFGPSPETLSQDDKTWLRHVLSRGLIKDPLDVEYLRSHLERMGTPLALSVPAWDKQDREENWIEASSFTEEDALAELENKLRQGVNNEWRIEASLGGAYLYGNYEDSHKYLIGDAGHLLDHLEDDLCPLVGTAHFRDAGVSQSVIDTWESVPCALDGHEACDLLRRLVPEAPQRLVILWACLEDHAPNGWSLPWGRVREVDSTWRDGGGKTVVITLEADDTDWL